MPLQEYFYEPQAPDPYCKFDADYTYSSSLFLQQVTSAVLVSLSTFCAKMLPGWQNALDALAVPQRCGRIGCLQRSGVRFSRDATVCGAPSFAAASHSLIPQVAQYPPLRVGRNLETWAFTLENEYVRPSSSCA